MDHDALRDAIQGAEVAKEAAWRAYIKSPAGDDAYLAYQDYIRAEARHAALIEAGLIVTLGTTEQDAA